MITPSPPVRLPHGYARRDGLVDFATGHPGRVAGTYEKSVGGSPYIIVYAIDRTDAAEVVVVLHVIHTARDWRAGAWPV